MSNRAIRLTSIAVALAILVVGVAYAFARPAEYQSGATLVLTPSPNKPADQPTLLDSFQRSGTVGTYVELLASDDTLRRAGSPNVTLSVRAIPDSRALRLTTTGDKNVVRPALDRIIATALRTQSGLDDLWSLRTLEASSAPSQSGPGKSFIIIASVLLALFGLIVARVGLGRWLGRPGPRREATAAASEDSPADSAEPVDFDLESFKYVRATPTTVLLQVAGYWRSSDERPLDAPVLLVNAGRRMHRLSLLSGPSNENPLAGPETSLWRGSYPAPVEVFDRRGRIAIQGGRGVVVGLPEPDEVRHEVRSNGTGADAEDAATLT